MSRPRLVLIRGGAGGRTPERSPRTEGPDTEAEPYARLVEIAGRCALYSALTSWVFDSVTTRASDPRFRGRRR